MRFFKPGLIAAGQQVQQGKPMMAKRIMLAAAVYNIGWGGIVSIFPQVLLFGSMPAPYVLILVRCIGMLVGTYGLAYYFCSRNPGLFWPFILVGFIGKVLGPLGAVFYVATGVLQPGFLLVNVFNDLIWLPPFGWILWQVLKGKLT